MSWLACYPVEPAYHSGRHYVGPGQEALANPTRKLDSTWQLGVFSYPCNASRWSSFNGLLGQDEYNALLPLAYVDGVPQPLTFKLTQTTDQGTVTISTPMYLLPPKPLTVPTGQPAWSWPPLWTNASSGSGRITQRE